MTGYWFVFVPRNIYYYGVMCAINLFFILTIGGYMVYTKKTKVNGYHPKVSVLIPAKDEEDHIFNVLEAYAKTNYPRDQLEVIVISDGSTDDTTKETKHAIDCFPETNIILLNFTTNSGKREALIEGLKHSAGEIIVINDSDSYIARDALFYLVQPLANPNVGGVSGHAQILNEDYNLLTKMQAVYYHYAYAVVRNMQSLFGAVQCLSGTLSAFRKTAFLEVFEEWVSRSPALGEDRSLTYLLLKHGYKTDYAPEAVVSTVAPIAFHTYTSQQIRWGKGFVLESFRGLFFMWRLPPLMAFLYYLQYLITIYTPWALIRVWYLSSTTVVFLFTVAFWWFLALTLKGLVAYKFNLKGLWLNLYAPLVLLIEVWKIPYVMLTVRPKEKWERPNGNSKRRVEG